MRKVALNRRRKRKSVHEDTQRSSLDIHLDCYILLLLGVTDGRKRQVNSIHLISSFLALFRAQSPTQEESLAGDSRPAVYEWYRLNSLTYGYSLLVVFLERFLWNSHAKTMMTIETRMLSTLSRRDRCIFPGM